MENMVVDDPAPTPSSVPSLLVHCTMTIGEVCAQYMDTVRQKRQEQFREVQTDAAYNHHLLQGHLQAEKQIRGAGGAARLIPLCPRGPPRALAVPHAGGGGCGRLQRGR